MTKTSDLTAILNRGRVRFLRFACARLGGSGEAEDVLQDLWLALSRARPAGEIGNPEAYIYRALDNMIRDRKRTAARRRALAESRIAPDEGLASDQTPTPEDVAMTRSRLEAVDRALETLSERTLKIFRAHRVEGRSQKEIAAELDISVSGVEKHLQRAYKEVASIRERIEAAEKGET